MHIISLAERTAQDGVRWSAREPHLGQARYSRNRRRTRGPALPCLFGFLGFLGIVAGGPSEFV